MAWVERAVVRDGVRLVCRDSGGPGAPVLLLHGLAGYAGEWDAVARLLAADFRVVAFDQRGHGASERRPGDVSRAAYTADAVAVVEELGLGPVLLVGQSLGGHTALLTAAERPELVRALVLVEAVPGDASPGTPKEIAAWLDSWPVPFPSREAAAAFFGGGPAGAAWAAGLEEGAGGLYPRFERDAMVGSLAEIGARSFRGEWLKVRCPVLAVFGQSGFVAPEDAEDMLARRPGTRAVSVLGAGHDVHLDRPEVLCRVLREFVEDGLE
ncbi:alpha/beta fold hydrolase [Streptomyces indicus]|uniref:Pimeloyl-ACP methyl ester carboxylesterase n=1 Tax=Streptomyces indicus TaxID=417292 RepID=A0A1G9HJ66_9ACTN|nr:alpha/beta hydrolase [Streptomyces indicus]SDL12987.1 Pimeloyl-ACP methyl ester carboxylesterase [Streptomyces indicus]